MDVEKQEVRFGDRVIKATVPDSARNQPVNGPSYSSRSRDSGAAQEWTAGLGLALGAPAARRRRQKKMRETGCSARYFWADSI